MGVETADGRRRALSKNPIAMALLLTFVGDSWLVLVLGVRFVCDHAQVLSGSERSEKSLGSS